MNAEQMRQLSEAIADAPDHLAATIGSYDATYPAGLLPICRTCGVARIVCRCPIVAAPPPPAPSRHRPDCGYPATSCWCASFEEWKDRADG